jgi:aminoglycoside phosphotransferase (APT) family kinase protein
MDFTPPAIEDYLSKRLDSAITVRDVERFGRGTSRETYLVAATEPAGQGLDLVFRRDPAAGAIDYSSLKQEFHVYDLLSRTDVPIAKALWWEDGSLDGRPFYVRQHVSGTWNIEHFLDPSPKYDQLRIVSAKEHLRGLAKVHAVDWRRLGLDEYLSTAPSAEECARHYVEEVSRAYEQFRIEPIPIFLEAKEWLLDQSGFSAPGVFLCKGTNGLGEEVFREGELVAMSDWEEAHIGDPAADLATTQNFLEEIVRDGERLWGMEEALDYYHSVGGANVSIESVRYYQQVRALRMLAYSHHAAAQLHAEPTAPIRQGWVATEVLHFSKRILAASMGLASMPESSYYMVELNSSVEMF